MRLLFVVCLGIGCAEPQESNSETPELPSPLLNLRGAFWLDNGERLPTQDPDWCQDLQVSRFDWRDRCFEVPPIACGQGVQFDFLPEPDVAWLVEVLSPECGKEEPVTSRAMASYASFAYEGRADDDPGVDLWRVNARTWRVRPLSDTDAEVVSDGVTFHLRETTRW
jgi:hypothetical protein